MPSSTAEVTVDIVDLNDNAPMFLQSMYTGGGYSHIYWSLWPLTYIHVSLAEISSNALTGTSILAVRATDADSSPQFRSVRFNKYIELIQVLL